jgi:uncharacterized membrane protein
MSQFVAITFQGEDDAQRALKTVRSLEHEGHIHVADTAVVARDADGKIRRKDELSSGTETGAVVGAVMGAILFILFPVAGIVGGAIVGGLLGRSLAPGIDGKFVQEVGDDLEPGGSALFLLIKEADMGLLIAGMRPYEGVVRQATLSEEDEQALEDALKSAR